MSTHQLISIPQAAIEINQAHVFLGEALSPIIDINSLRIEYGTRIGLLGPSGAGKTTLLRLINSHISPTGGELKVLGSRITPHAGLNRLSRRKIGFIYQKFHLIERATVYENVLWGRLGYVGLTSLLGIFPKHDREVAKATIDEVSLTNKINVRVDQLSGGEQQRVGIARALAQNPSLILADEPVSSLDPELSEEILEILVDASNRHKVTLVMSLHQPDLAKKFSSTIIGLNKGQILYNDTPDNLTKKSIQMIYERSEPLDLPSDTWKKESSLISKS